MKDRAAQGKSRNAGRLQTGTRAGVRSGPPIAVWLSLATIFLLAPFLDKPWHIDDPLFLWSARQIHRAPADFFGCPVNWKGMVQPLAQVTQNPPLQCYFLAGGAALGGWHERWLHGLQLLPAVGCVLGAWSMARRLTKRAELAALLVLTSPLFLVSATTVMCDLLLLCLWLWSLILWWDGLDRRSGVRLAGSSLLIGFAVLTKYFGIALVPLLLLVTLVRRRKLTTELLWLLPPSLLLAGYDSLTAHLYFEGGFSQAVKYARQSAPTPGWGARCWKGITALAYAGGGSLGLLCLLPALLRSGWKLGAGLLAGGLLIWGIQAGNPELLRPQGSRAVTWDLAVQAGLFVSVGSFVVWLCLNDMWQTWRTRASLGDAQNAAAALSGSVLLAAWLLGTLIFAGGVNWTINGRSLLPLIPAAGILVARRSERESVPWTPGWLRWLPAGKVLGRGWQHLFGSFRPAALALLILPGGMIGWLVAQADYSAAQAQRQAAHLALEVPIQAGKRCWFDGHWGFQYYMEAGGGMPLAQHGPTLRAGEYVVLPTNNTLNSHLPAEALEIQQNFQIVCSNWAYTQSAVRRAGFYSDLWGPLPYVLGSEWIHAPRDSTGNYAPHLDKYLLLKLTHDVRQ